MEMSMKEGKMESIIIRLFPSRKKKKATYICIVFSQTFYLIPQQPCGLVTESIISPINISDSPLYFSKISLKKKDLLK